MKRLLFSGIVVLLILFTGCSDKKDSTQAPAEADKPVNPNGLTDFEMENGIGPVKTKLSLAELDMMRVKEGEKIFTEKCSACHKLNERYVGPAQGDLLSRRSPEYIINMIMNPEVMLAKHPEAKKMLAEYLTPMPFQNVTMDDAMKLLDYFRHTANTQTTK